MRAVAVRDRDVGERGMTIEELPYPRAAENDVIVRVHAAGYTPGELNWPSTWTDRAGNDRTPSILGHEVSGVVAELGYGTTGFSIGQRVFGMTDWARNGTLAEYVAVEARNLAALPADIDYPTAAALPISGLTAWQALFDHGHLTAGQTVLVHGGGGAVGSVAIQLARNAGACVIATGKARDRDPTLKLGASRFIDLQEHALDQIDKVDLVLDVIGGQILALSADLVREGGTLVTIAESRPVQVRNGRSIFFVVEPDRQQLTKLIQCVRTGTLQPLIGAVRPFLEAPQALGTQRHTGTRTIIAIEPPHEIHQPTESCSDQPGSSSASIAGATS